jgi:hypothetical protein
VSLNSASAPKEDETDIGNRDPALKRTYKGLVNLRWAFLSFSALGFNVVEFV